MDLVEYFVATNFLNIVKLRLVKKYQKTGLKNEVPAFQTNTINLCVYKPWASYARA